MQITNNQIQSITINFLQDIDQLDPEIREVINKVKIVIKPLVVREKTPVNHEKENALKLKLLKKVKLVNNIIVKYSNVSMSSWFFIFDNALR